MIRVAIVRGKYLNNFEGQNFIFNKKKIFFVAFSSLYSLHEKFSFPVIKLPSLADLGFIPVLEKGIKWLSNRVLGDSQILFGLQQYASKFDIFDTADPHYFYSYQLAKLRKEKKLKKLIISYWDTIPFNNEGTNRKKYIKYFTLNQADLILVHTLKSKKALINEGINDKKIKIVRLGVDMEKFKPKRKSLKSNFAVLFVGRLVEEKGVLDLFYAFKKVAEKNIKKLQLKIIGEGPLKRKLEILIKQNHLGNIISIESKRYEQMPSVYQKADIFVSCSKTTKTWEEQYGMVLIEAMASGLPIIAYNSGVIAEILGETGLLVNEGEIDELSKNILRLAKDNHLREKLGKMGRKRALKFFDAKKTAKKLEKIYTQLS
ncbi:MAG: glycosyltransferase family 4 protein [Microgenomates group bacterium]